MKIRNIEWMGEAGRGHLRLLDQTLLPTQTVYVECRRVADVWEAIKRLAVRGAPAIGVAAAYACVLAVQGQNKPEAALAEAADYLAKSRPTAVNLFWALARMRRVAPCTAERLLAEARLIHEEDAAMCQAIGRHALPLLREALGGASDRGVEPPGVLTHCNAGALATGGIGTATAAMYLGAAEGLKFRVWADETRPLLQGARLTAYELRQEGIDVRLICDGMAAQVMREGRVRVVITGADRIAANGDAANKIGTYGVAVLARHHRLPFYVAAPSSTFDLSIADGSHIPIEERGGEEITHGFGRRTAPVGVETYSPAFDVTPHELITAIITERGVIQPVTTERVAAMLA